MCSSDLCPIESGRREGVRLGIRWALGHSIAVAVFGTGLVLLKAAVPTWFNTVAECLIGFVLVGVGAWLVREVFRQQHLHFHWHEHDGHQHFHVHSHQHGTDHTHDHKLTALGILHGLAGTSGVLLLLPVGLANSTPAALVYVFTFGAGTICSMALFGAFAGRLFIWFQRWNRGVRIARGAVGVTSCVVGFVWIGNAVQHFTH